MQHVVGGIRPASNNSNPTVPVSRELWASDKNYLGNDALWLDLPRDGTVRGTSVSITEYQTAPGQVIVTARRIDGVGATATVEKDENPGGGPRDRAATIHFSTAGCWEVTYKLEGSQLSFVVGVEGP